MSDYKNALDIGSQLDGRYRLDAVLGAGGFGIVYRATHTHLGTEHAIKEYLPQEIAVREGASVHPLSTHSREDYREGLARFLREARQLVQFAGHPNIVNCNDFFEANGTAYLVMQYENGLPLSELAAAREGQERPFSEAEVLGLMRPLLSGLKVVHAANVLHRDIKPGNIFIRRADEQPVLLDFGAAKEDFSRHSKSRAPHTPGYAALEQVEDEGELGPWTDLYAVGGVFYRLMSGQAPRKVEQRISQLLRGQADPLQLDEQTGDGRFSAGLIAAVRDCLAVDQAQRVQSVDELLARLDGLDARSAPASEQRTSPVAAMNSRDVDTDAPTTRQAPASASGRKRVIRYAAPAAVLAALALGVLLWPEADGDRVEEPVVTVPSETGPSDEPTRAGDQSRAEELFAQAVRAWYWEHEESEAVHEQFRQAAEWGHVTARAELAKQLWLGSGVERDRMRAMQVAQDALADLRGDAEAGDAPAHTQYLLGWYHDTDGLLPADIQDYELAHRWYLKAAEQGYAHAQNNLGALYQQGVGTSMDDERAAHWFRKAAEQGHVAAQHNLGWSYARGEGVSQDAAEAASWFGKAAEQGDMAAQNDLGIRYLRGEGVPQDDAEAARWFRKAAAQGHSGARHALASLNED